MSQIAWKAIFPHFSIDFVHISLQAIILSEETKGHGIVYGNLTPGQGIIFTNLTPGQGSFSDFPAAPPRMFVDQVPPLGLKAACHVSDWPQQSELNTTDFFVNQCV